MNSIFQFVIQQAALQDCIIGTGILEEFLQHFHRISDAGYNKS